jgi:general secretion pathway protein K
MFPFMRRPELKGALDADGFILVAVLWILAALAALASVYAVYIANTAISARAYDHRLQTEALVTAGLELTAYRLIGFDDNPKFGCFRLPNWRVGYWRGIPFRGGAH